LIDVNGGLQEMKTSTKRPIGRVAMLLYAVSFAGLAVSIALRHSDALWLARLVYISAGALVAAAFVTLFAISRVGGR
jgi:quinol-cytochrome oxidoreductase complex cytochrome b subunit